jgi:lipopolysaccharide export system protein LptA
MGRYLVTLGLACLAGSSVAAIAPLQGSIKFDADVVDSDLRNDSHVLGGNVHVTQGTSSIEAAKATATALQSPRSSWTFDRDVHIQTAEADLKSNNATAAFVDGKIATAVAKGTPALFEQRRGPADKLVKGRAGVIDYDVNKGVVRLSDKVWFSYGGNEFRGNVVVYNIRDERVVVNPAGEEKGRVNITIKPRTLEKSKQGDAPAPASGDGA